MEDLPVRLEIGGQDLTRWLDNNRSQIPNMIFLTMPIAEAINYNLITSHQEVWFGHYSSSFFWVQDELLFGGYTRRTRVVQDAGELTYQIALWDYGILLDAAGVRGYPMDPIYLNYASSTNIREWHLPPLEDEPNAVSGYAYDPGYTWADWIVSDGSGKPAPGLIPMFLPGVDIGHVDSIYSSNVFDRSARPSNSAIRGYLERTNLRGALDLVLAECAFIEPTMRPYYQLRAVTDGVVIKPEFRLLDLSNTEGVDWFYSDTDSGSNLWWDYAEDHEGDGLLKRVEVFGVGREFSSTDPVEVDIDLYKRVFGASTDFLEPDAYPTPYMAIPGWAGEPIFDSRIRTSEEAFALANRIANAARTEQLTISFITADPVRKGDVIDVTRAATGISGTFPVLDSQWIIYQGLTCWRIQAGWKRSTPTDILTGPTIPLLNLATQGIRRNARGAGLNFSVPTLPSERGIDANPRASRRNAIAAMTDRIGGINPQAAVNYSHLTPDEMAVGSDPDNYGFAEDGSDSDPLPEPPLRPVPGTDFLPMPRYWTRTTSGALAEWDDQRGYNHPIHYHYSFEADGHEDIGSVFSPILISTIAAVREYDADNKRVDIDAGIAVRLLLENETTHLMEAVDPPVDALHPIYLTPDGRAAQVEIEGVPAGHTVKVECSERGIDTRFFVLGGLP